MDENRIHEFYDHDDNIVKFVTHADYKALEDELAALRGKVRELVEADRNFDAAREADGPGREGCVRIMAERRRRTLEALS